MDRADFDSQIAEIQAEHTYILDELNIITSPEGRLYALELLSNLRHRLHDVGARYRQELRQKRQASNN